MSVWTEIVFKYWKIRQWFDSRRKYTPGEQEQLVGYYNTAMNIFKALNIDVASMQPEKQHLYHMMLVYADHHEAVMPKSARIATMLQFLHSRKHGWTAPPASQAVSDSWAEEVDNYVGVEIFSSKDGLKDIYDEICSKANQFGAQLNK